MGNGSDWRCKILGWLRLLVFRRCPFFSLTRAISYSPFTCVLGCEVSDAAGTWLCFCIHILYSSVSCFHRQIVTSLILKIGLSKLGMRRLAIQA